MQIRIDSQGFVTDFSLIGSMEGGVEVAPPEDVGSFCQRFRAWRAEGGSLTFDGAKAEELANTAVLEGLRARRETECFPIINRGQLWYATLTPQKILELTTWYKAWLDVTVTKTVPEIPEWLNAEVHM